MPDGRRFDCVGIGLNAVDHMAVVDGMPAVGSRSNMRAYAREGGGQVATALCAQARLGLRVKYLGKVGDDDNGAFSMQSLRSHGVDISNVVTVPGEESQVAVILVVQGSGERTICWRRGPGLAFTADDFSNGVVLQGRYLYVDTHEIGKNIEVAQAARERGIPVLIDAEATRPRVDELLKLCDVVLADENFGRQFTNLSEPADIMRALQRHSGARTVGITLGPQGSRLLVDGEMVEAPAYPAPIVDTTGAGDVWHGAFGYAMLRGWPPDRTLRFANAAAALSCGGLGGRGALPRLETVAALMGETLEDLPPECERTGLPASPLLDDAFAFAREAHRGQTRDEGTPYFAHPCRVARILSHELEVTGEAMLAAALLHDTLEDVPIDRAYFAARFGGEVSHMVATLTKDDSLPREARDQQYFAGLEAASDNTILVKMADRIDNLRQLHLSKRPGKRARYLEETRQHHVPLSTRVPRASALLLRTLQEIP